MTRRVEIAGIAPVPNGLWMHQVPRNLIDEVGGFLRGKGFLIHDRDPLYTREFRELLGHVGVTSVQAYRCSLVSTGATGFRYVSHQRSSFIIRCTLFQWPRIPCACPL